MGDILQALWKHLYKLFVERTGDAGRVIRSVDSDDIVKFARLALLYEVFPRARSILLLEGQLRRRDAAVWAVL